MIEYIPLFLFLAVFVVLLSGYPVAFSLGGTAVIFAIFGVLTDTFDSALFYAVPSRLFGIMTNNTLIAVPLFVFMGVVLEKAKIAEGLLVSMAELFGSVRGGLAISVTLVGMLLAASTGIVGATVVTMGLLSLPTMRKRGYDDSLSSGVICATGTLGQIIPPSLALVLLGDVLSNAYQKAQLDMGVFSPKTVSVADLFIGALIPGLMLVVFYILYIMLIAWYRPELAPVSVEQDSLGRSKRELIIKLIPNLLPPVLLMLSVLGSILAGFATPTEAAGVGAMGALILAGARKALSLKELGEAVQSTTQVVAMVFLILIGASIFSLVFRGFGGEELIQSLFERMPGGIVGATALVMLVIFLLGFILDFIEITFVVVPMVAPVLLAMGLDPVWLGIMIALNLQTSFLTPPFGFALFYLRGVAPADLMTKSIYKGVAPFIFIQIFLMLLLALWPQLVTWLPAWFYTGTV
ncbi:MAG: TRAP transporter large permease subunit [Gammaproteobacteria bacterium]|nr:TRAP transporter large permease subunit [Gammaproteobacteria bacterium]